jgi:hypothetical protein
MRVEMKHNRHSEGLLRELVVGSRLILQRRLQEGSTPIGATMDASSLALEASKAGLSPII